MLMNDPDDKPLRYAYAYGEFRKGMSVSKDKQFIDTFNISGDTRIIYMGMKYIIDQYIAQGYTKRDLEELIELSSIRNIGGDPYPCPSELLKTNLEIHNGASYNTLNYNDSAPFPVRIYTLDEGTVIQPRTPVYVLEATEDFAPLVTYLESTITHVWYQSSVATLSRRCKTLIATYFKYFVKEGVDHPSLDYKLHDFGFRGTTCNEQSLLGGVAHLLNFKGTDNILSIVYLRNRYCTRGESVIASEHACVESYDNTILSGKDHKALDMDAIDIMIQKTIDYKNKHNMSTIVLSLVMDTRDYDEAINNVLSKQGEGKVRFDKIIKNNLHLVYRPDSGNPIVQVLKALYSMKKVCTKDHIDVYNLDTTNNNTTTKDKSNTTKDKSNINTKDIMNKISDAYDKIINMKDNEELKQYDEFMNLNNKNLVNKFSTSLITFKHTSVLQGDGIDYGITYDILTAVVAHGFSPLCISFGMGGGLMQSVNRDTMSFATKLSYICHRINSQYEHKVVMKTPVSISKQSLPGMFYVNRKNNKIMVGSLTKEISHVESNIPQLDKVKAGLLKLIYDGFGDESYVKRRVGDADFNHIIEQVDKNWDISIPVVNYEPFEQDLLDLRVKAMNHYKK